MTGDETRLSPYPLGAHYETDGICFSFVSGSDDCGILLYEKKSGKFLKKIPFEKEERMGNIHQKRMSGIDASAISYQFYEEGHVLPDLYARCYEDWTAFGKMREEQALKASFLSATFDWEGDSFPHIPYENSICYLLHVRGFTRHSSSGVIHKGCFKGIVEKIPYLKELGITTIELQPAYEFLELEESREPEEAFMRSYLPVQHKEPKLNYWGYKKGFYYAPKANFASGDDPYVEFCEMVKALHQNGMEVVMQFYFPKEVYAREIPDILLYWVSVYHVDGFHVMGEQLPVNLIAEEEGLADTKLWFSELDTDSVVSEKAASRYRRIAIYRDDYLYDMRRFLKGDSDMLTKVIHHMRSNPPRVGRINYLTNYYGFTMMDLVTYDEKHNEPNGEGNRDGNNDNQSWNCGVEGASRKKQVTSLRIKQYKNAIAMLFLSQATPLLFMGDEFGNSQKGNNNPYCQDNEIAWLNWQDKEKNSNLFQFTSNMIALRKAHPILHQKKELCGMDSISCGYPDLSYHGEEAWRPSMERGDRQIGIMYCGKYASLSDGKEDDFLYVAFNMHWDTHEFALPRLPKNLEWHLLFRTEETGKDTAQESEQKKEKASAAYSGLVKRLPPRTVAVFISREKS